MKMPNWCENGLYISHEDKEQIDRIEKAFIENTLLNEFHPCPKELVDTVSGYLNEDYAQELNQFKQQLNLKYFGAKDWYDWHLQNWGTKWDISSNGFNRLNDNTFSCSFNTAWSPPLEFYQHMETLGFNIDAMYFEGGMMFCGQYSDGIDDYYNIQGDCKWVIDNIPENIDLEFCISENMAIYEEQELLDLINELEQKIENEGCEETCAKYKVEIEESYKKIKELERIV
jgi:hypothetical protein